MKKRQFSKYIIEQAPYYGVKAIPLDPRWQFFTLSKGKTTHLFFNGILNDTTSASSARLVRHKSYALIYLQANNYPVLPQIWTNDKQELKNFLKTNKRVVVKPPNKEGGLGVYVDIKNINELEIALTKVAQYCKKPITQKHFEGNDVRVTVINNKYVFAVQRTKPFVIGDGKSSIKELIKAKNSKRNIYKGQKLLQIDQDLTYFLKKQRLQLDSVPSKDRKIILGGVANLSKGGDSEVVTQKLSNEIKKEAIQISKDLKLNVIGIDYLISGKKRYIIELNATPGFRLHQYPTIGKGENLTKIFFEMLFGLQKEKKIFYQFNSFKDYQKVENEKLDIPGTFIGLGVTAFMRYFPSTFLKKFVIYCVKDSTDNDLIEKSSKVYALKKKWPNIKLKFTNANNLLLNKTVRKEINKITGDKYLFVYKMNSNLSKAIELLDIKKVIAVSPQLNKMFENKDSFRRQLVKMGVKPIHGLNITFKQFQKMSFEGISKKVGFPFVIQMPDFLLGGGKGTIFIHSKEDYDQYYERSLNGKYKGKLLTRVIITKFINGDSCSIQCCATKYGTLSSQILTQIMDVPQVIQTGKGSGLFVGHVFGRNYGKENQKQASKLASKIGDYMYKKGFRGIFGIDIMVDRKNNKVYPVEVNARYTGAYPMFSMLLRDNKIIPFDIFHFMENLNIKYKISINRLKRMYEKNVKGSHIIISNQQNKSIIAKRTIKAGLYQWNDKNKTINFIKPTLNFAEIKNHNQFIICDGTPKKGDVIKRYTSVARISHLLFTAEIIKNNGELKDEYKELIRYLYKYIFGARYKY